MRGRLGVLTQRGVRGGGAGERLDTLGLKLRGGPECPEGLRRPSATQQRTTLGSVRVREDRRGKGGRASGHERRQGV